MPPPMIRCWTLPTRFSSTASLDRHLGPAHHGSDRGLRSTQRGIQRLQFRFHRPARIGRQHMRQPFGAGMGAVRGGKGIVDVEIAICGDGLREQSGSFSSSPGQKRVFSSKPISPLPRMPTDCATTGPATSGMNITSRPSTCCSRPAPCSGYMVEFRSPLGRPKCASSSTLAPRSASSRIVGATASDPRQIGHPPVLPSAD